MTPSINQLVHLLEVNFEVGVKSDLSCKQQLIDLEFQVVEYLDFDLQIQTPTVFLGRFLILQLQKLKSKTQCKSIESTATQLCKFASYQADMLNHRPSHIAAAVCVLTLNIFASEALTSIGVADAPF